MERVNRLENRGYLKDIKIKDYLSSLKKLKFGEVILGSITIVTMFLIVFIVSSLVLRADLSLLGGDNAIIEALKVTGKSILISNIIVVALGLPFSFYLSTRKGLIYKILGVFSQLPILIPPAITGMAMFTAFGRRGSINVILDGANFSFKFYSIVLVQVFIGLPFFIQVVKNGFDRIGKEIVEAAQIDGVGLMDMLFKIYVPLAWRSIACGMIMSILRGVGEFGATMMFAGNISGRTQTITTLIYTYSQTDINKAIALAGANILFFVIPLFLFKLKSEE